MASRRVLEGDKRGLGETGEVDLGALPREVL